MTIRSVRLISVDGGESENSLKYSAKYHVVSDSRNDGPMDVRQATGIPAYGSIFSIGTPDPRARATSIKESLVSDDNGFLWHVDIEWSAEDQTTDFDNPLRNPLEISITFQGESRRVFRTATGAIIRNTAGTPFAIDVEDNIPLLNYRINLALNQWTIANCMLVRNAVNGDPWLGGLLAPGQVKVASITGRRVRHKSVGYYAEWDFSFKTSVDGWNNIINESRGTWEIVGGKYRPIFDPVQGQLVTEEKSLDINGRWSEQSGLPPATITVAPYPVLNYTATFPFLN